MINNVGLVESKIAPLGKMTLEELFRLSHIDESPAWELNLRLFLNCVVVLAIARLGVGIG